MAFLDQIFGTSLPLPVRFLIAFAVVLGLIALTAWLVRRLASRKLPLSNAGRGRQPRLGVLDAFAIDARRRLVLIRRDNVEHLIMIGGPNDVLVESQIVRAPAQSGLQPQRSRQPNEGQQQRPQAQAPGASPAPSPMPARTPTPVPAPQPAAVRAVPPPPPPAEPPPEHPARQPSTFFRATMARPAEPARPAPAAPEPPAAPAISVDAPAARPKADVDPLFADIERRLEEAIHRGPSAASAPAPRPSPAPAPGPAPAARSRPAPAPAERPAPASSPTQQKSHLDALEEEMASLLGRDRQS